MHGVTKLVHASENVTSDRSHAWSLKLRKNSVSSLFNLPQHVDHTVDIRFAHLFAHSRV